jgi:hypothetical protein
MELSGQSQAPTALPPGERAPAAHWIDGGVSLGAGLDAVVIILHLAGTRTEPLCRPSRSQSLYLCRIKEDKGYIP